MHRFSAFLKGQKKEAWAAKKAVTIFVLKKRRNLRVRLGAVGPTTVRAAVHQDELVHQLRGQLPGQMS
jgi:hypothetical protein